MTANQAIVAEPATTAAIAIAALTRRGVCLKRFGCEHHHANMRITGRKVRHM
jgi:hypothetical protein